MEEEGDFGFARGGLVGHAEDARQLAGARGDAHAPDGGGTRFGSFYGLLQEDGGLQFGSFAELLQQDEAERQHGGSGERPAQARIAPRREEARQAGNPGFGVQFRIDTFEIEALPWFRLMRQTRS